MMMGLAV